MPITESSGRFSSTETIYILPYFSPVVINILVLIKLGEGVKITRNKICFRNLSGMYFFKSKFSPSSRILFVYFLTA